MGRTPTAWVMVEAGFLDSWKLKEAATMLATDRYALGGHLVKLWGWAFMAATQDGVLWRATAEDIAEHAGWRGEEGAFLDALVRCGEPDHQGFIEIGERCLILHDWQDYSGKYQAKLQGDAARKRNQYQSKDNSMDNSKDMSTDNSTEFSRESPRKKERKKESPPPNTTISSPGRRSNGDVENSVELSTDNSGGVVAAADRLLAHFRKRIDPNTRDHPYRLIEDRLRAYSEEDLHTAIDRFAGDSGHMERVGHKPPSWFFSTDSLIAEFLAIRPGSNGAHAPRGKGRRGHSLSDTKPFEDLYDALQRSAGEGGDTRDG